MATFVQDYLALRNSILADVPSLPERHMTERLAVSDPCMDSVALKWRTTVKNLWTTQVDVDSASNNVTAWLKILTEYHLPENLRKDILRRDRPNLTTEGLAEFPKAPGATDWYTKFSRYWLITSLGENGEVSSRVNVNLLESDMYSMFVDGVFLAQANALYMKAVASQSLVFANIYKNANDELVTEFQKYTKCKLSEIARRAIMDPEYNLKTFQDSLQQVTIKLNLLEVTGAATSEVLGSTTASSLIHEAIGDALYTQQMPALKEQMVDLVKSKIDDWEKGSYDDLTEDVKTFVRDTFLPKARDVGSIAKSTVEYFWEVKADTAQMRVEKSFQSWFNALFPNEKRVNIARGVFTGLMVGAATSSFVLLLLEWDKTDIMQRVSSIGLFALSIVELINLACTTVFAEAIKSFSIKFQNEVQKFFKSLNTADREITAEAAARPIPDGADEAVPPKNSAPQARSDRFKKWYHDFYQRRGIFYVTQMVAPLYAVVTNTLGLVQQIKSGAPIETIVLDGIVSGASLVEFGALLFGMIKTRATWTGPLAIFASLIGLAAFIVKVLLPPPNPLVDFAKSWSDRYKHPDWKLVPSAEIPSLAFFFSTYFFLVDAAENSPSGVPNTSSILTVLRKDKYNIAIRNRQGKLLVATDTPSKDGKGFVASFQSVAVTLSSLWTVVNAPGTPNRYGLLAARSDSRWLSSNQLCQASPYWDWRVSPVWQVNEVPTTIFGITKNAQNALRIGSDSSGAWGTWDNLGGNCLQLSVANSSGEPLLFTLGSDRRVWQYKPQSPQASPSWGEILPGSTVNFSAISAMQTRSTVTPDDFLQIFAIRSSDGKVMWTEHFDSEWVPWNEVYYNGPNSPAVQVFGLPCLPFGGALILHQNGDLIKVEKNAQHIFTATKLQGWWKQIAVFQGPTGKTDIWGVGGDTTVWKIKEDGNTVQVCTDLGIQSITILPVLWENSCLALGADGIPFLIWNENNTWKKNNWLPTTTGTSAQISSGVLFNNGYSVGVMMKQPAGRVYFCKATGIVNIDEVNRGPWVPLPDYPQDPLHTMLLFPN